MRSDRVAMSRAVVAWPGLGRPEAFLKVVRLMPSERAVLVIRVGKGAFAAGDVFADRRGDVIGGERDQRLDRILDRNGLAGRYAELGRAPCRRRASTS